MTLGIVLVLLGAVLYFTAYDYGLKNLPKTDQRAVIRQNVSYVVMTLAFFSLLAGIILFLINGSAVNFGL
jgi:hypothetical protein